MIEERKKAILTSAPKQKTPKPIFSKGPSTKEPKSILLNPHCYWVLVKRGGYF
jgi:hypothetical protein